MTVKRIFLLIFLTAATFVTTRSQAVPQPILLYERNNANYEEMLAILDSTALSVFGHPGSKCVIVVHGKVGDVERDLELEQVARRYFVSRAGPQLKDRWKFVRARQTEKRMVRAWLIPAGAQMPQIDEAEWSFRYPEGTKPFIVEDCGYSPEWEPEPCSYVDRINVLAQLLKADPKARTNIVLRVRSRTEFATRKRKILANLRETYDVRAKQVRFFEVIAGPYPDRIESTVQYWFVP